MRWCPMAVACLPAVLALADAVHPDHPEDREVFTERLALHPAGCLVLEADGEVCGYALAHPWSIAAPPALNTRLGRLPARPDTLHLHDIALIPALRGAGQAAAALEVLLGQAQALGLSRATLVAIAGKQDYWVRRGFHPLVPSDPASLRSYGAGAGFMARTLPG
jgi:GNAT superfamily N-acetyltransferase